MAKAATPHPTPLEELTAGARILAPLLEPHGYRFSVTEVGSSSGGPFASGSFVRRDRRLELHFRHSLGLVRYHVGEVSIDHSTYMRLLGADAAKLYPTFSLPSRDQFQALAHDLEAFAKDFLTGDAAQFRELAREYAAHPSAIVVSLLRSARCAHDRTKRTSFTASVARPARRRLTRPSSGRCASAAMPDPRDEHAQRR